MRFLQIRSACGWMSDHCCGHFGSQRGSFQRNRHGSAICKKRSQKCGVATLILSNICFSFISVTYTCKPIYKSEFSKSLISLFHQFFWCHLIIFFNKSKDHLFHLLRNIQNIINTNRFWFFNHLFDHT